MKIPRSAPCFDPVDNPTPVPAFQDHATKFSTTAVPQAFASPDSRARIHSHVFGTRNVGPRLGVTGEEYLRDGNDPDDHHELQESGGVRRGPSVVLRAASNPLQVACWWRPKKKGKKKPGHTSTVPLWSLRLGTVCHKRVDAFYVLHLDPCASPCFVSRNLTRTSPLLGIWRHPDSKPWNLRRCVGCKNRDKSTLYRTVRAMPRREQYLVNWNHTQARGKEKREALRQAARMWSGVSCPLNLKP